MAYNHHYNVFLGLKFRGQMSMFKKLKGLFVIEEDSPQKGKDKTDKTTVQKKSSIAQKNEQNLEDLPKVKVDGKPSTKFVDVLLKAIETNNLEGFDYLEFKQSLQSLANVSMDEKTRYQSAFAMAKTMGASPQNLVKSANHYLSILKKEESKFLQALKGQRSKQIEDKKTGLENLKKELTRKETEIKKLQAEIDKDKIKLSKYNDEMKKSEMKLATTKASFEKALHVVAGQIQQDIDQMSKYGLS